MDSRPVLSIDCRCGASRRKGVAQPDRCPAAAAKFTPRHARHGVRRPVVAAPCWHAEARRPFRLASQSSTYRVWPCSRPAPPSGIATSEATRQSLYCCAPTGRVFRCVRNDSRWVNRFAASHHAVLAHRHSSATETPVAPVSNRFRWKLTSPSPLACPNRAAKADRAAGSQASALAYASR